MNTRWLFSHTTTRVIQRRLTFFYYFFGSSPRPTTLVSAPSVRVTWVSVPFYVAPRLILRRLTSLQCRTGRLVNLAGHYQRTAARRASAGVGGPWDLSLGMMRSIHVGLCNSRLLRIRPTGYHTTQNFPQRRTSHSSTCSARAPLG